MSAKVFHCTECDIWSTIEWSDGLTWENAWADGKSRAQRFRLTRVLPAFTDESGGEWCEVHEGTHVERRCKEFVREYNDQIVKTRSRQGVEDVYRKLMGRLR
jgi:hypothetical protein